MTKSIASLSKMWHKIINIENTLFPALKETLRIEELSTKESKLIRILDFAEIKKNITVVSITNSNMSKKIIILLLIFSNILLGVETIVVHSIIKNNKEKQKEMFKVLEIKPVDFSPIVSYANKLYRYGLKEESLDYRLSIINKATDIYGEESIVTKISYLLLANYYALTNELLATNEILNYVIETTENKKYENYQFYKQMINLSRAGYLTLTGAYQKANIIYEEIAKNYFRCNSCNKAYIFNQIASNHNMLGNYTTSIKYTQKALTIEKEHKLKKEKDTVVDTFINYSKSYSLQKDYNHASAVLEVIITIYEAENVSYFPELRNLYTEYSSVLIRLGDWNTTKKAAKKSIDIQRKLQITNDYATFINYTNIAEAEKNLKNYEEARIMFVKGLKIIKQINIPIYMKEKYTIYINKNLLALESSKIIK